MPLTDVFRYWAEIQTVLNIFKSAGRLAVGQSEPVSPITMWHAGKEYRWEKDAITRIR